MVPDIVIIDLGKRDTEQPGIKRVIPNSRKTGRFNGRRKITLGTRWRKWITGNMNLIIMNSPGIQVKRPGHRLRGTPASSRRRRSLHW